jgi:hypothetical protein
MPRNARPMAPGKRLRIPLRQPVTRSHRDANREAQVASRSLVLSAHRFRGYSGSMDRDAKMAIFGESAVTTSTPRRRSSLPLSGQDKLGQEGQEEKPEVLGASRRVPCPRPCVGMRRRQQQCTASRIRAESLTCPGAWHTDTQRIKALSGRFSCADATTSPRRIIAILIRPLQKKSEEFFFFSPFLPSDRA